MQTLEEIKAQLRARTLGKQTPIIETPIIVPIAVDVMPTEIEPIPQVTAPVDTRDLTDLTREKWLTEASDLIRRALPFTISPFRVSAGFPRGSRGSDKFKGQTIAAAHTTDGKAQIFVTPVAASVMQALTVLTLEMLTVRSQVSGTSVSALALTVGMEANDDKTYIMYGAPFLPGKLTSLYAEIERKLGSYPHAAVKSSAYKPRPSMPKVYCTIDGPDSYKARVADIWLDKLGAPLCPCHNEKMTVEAS